MVANGEWTAEVTVTRPKNPTRWMKKIGCPVLISVTVTKCQNREREREGRVDLGDSRYHGAVAGEVPTCCSPTGGD